MKIPASKAGIMPAISLLRNKNMGARHRSDAGRPWQRRRPKAAAVFIRPEPR
jgi:hypothetical protein